MRSLAYALEGRRRVKEQLKKIGGMEFFVVHFSYIDQETLEKTFVPVPEQGGGKFISDSALSPGSLHTIATGANGHLGLTAWRPRRQQGRARRLAWGQILDRGRP